MGEELFSLKFCVDPLTTALLSLMHHSIEHGDPIRWVGDLKYLTLVPQGEGFLNNFNFQALRRGRSKEFWTKLYNLWSELNRFDLRGFEGILLNVCEGIEELLGFLGFFQDARLTSMLNSRIFFFFF